MIDYITNDELGESIRGKLNTIVERTNGKVSGVDIRLGSGGQSGEVQDALEEITAFQKRYINSSTTNGLIRSTVTITSNMTMTKPVIVSGLNLGHVEIRATEGTLSVAIPGSQAVDVSEYLGYGNSVIAGFLAKNGGVLPVLSGSISLSSNTHEDTTLVNLFGGSSYGALRPRGAGVTVLNGGGNGQDLVSLSYGATFHARQASLLNAGRNSINCASGSFASIHSSVLTGADQYAVNCLRGSKVIVHNCPNISVSNPQTPPLNVEEFSQIIASGTTSAGGNIDDNTWGSGNEGFIYKG